jgi:hypothetical protein
LRREAAGLPARFLDRENPCFWLSGRGRERTRMDLAQ